jgi:hypothetical protein
MLPRFLYPDNQEYNEEDMDDGVLRGHLMLRVCTLTFLFFLTIVESSTRTYLFLLGCEAHLPGS